MAIGGYEAEKRGQVQVARSLWAALRQNLTDEQWRAVVDFVAAWMTSESYIDCLDDECAEQWRNAMQRFEAGEN